MNNAANSNNKIYYKRPYGVVNKNYTPAAHASADTSEQLVSPSDKDAFYFRALENQGIRLNQRQISAVRHIDGPILTLAGAGSGKTSVLVCRTGYMLSVRGIPPQQLLLMTFSKKAADEMKLRISQLPNIGQGAASRIEARTFHSFCLLMLRRRGYKQNILGETGRKQIYFKRLLRERNLHETYQPETLITLLSSYKMQMIAVPDLPEKSEEERQLKLIFTSYEEWKRQLDLIDYDDMLLEAYQLLKQDENLLAMLQNRFRYVMIDEFQDTNTIQYEIIKLLVQPHRNLMVVGDDDQTIYSFNGARNDYILNFEKQFPGAKNIILDVNYRSGSGIVGLGNAVIRHNKQRRSKTLLTAKPHGLPPVYARPGNSDDEADLIVNTLLQQKEKKGRSFRDFAILFRTASSSRAIFDQLVIRQVPFIDYGSGESLYEQWVIKPVIAHLRLSIDRRNFDAMEAMLATMYVRPDQAMAFIWNEDKKQAKKWPLIHLTRFPEIKSFHQDKIKERIKLIRSLEKLKPEAAIRRLRIEFYDQFIEANKSGPALTEHKDSLKEMLDELEASAKRFDGITAFLAFIDEIAAKHEEMKRMKLDSSNADAVNFMTIHKSKGLEFPVVFVCGVSEGILPHSSAITAEKNSDRSAIQAGDNVGEAAMEEERRLAYVAVTRAEEELYISSPAYYRGKPAAVSSFIIHAYS
ncbi:ATP-dependent helicase [Paenibacillus sp. JDR-2]|uniref:ATP-dependent helicase n=1 Tax=Paenibacillus sp. (strain JDR-2) TaxID=324057 RepID=UPI0001664030|nr:ATP-dependent helicase [Paenibacillus sp. JDR-2]ACS99943.1 UvrD/REP helicase [Paenibacillus sp. JDR-2]